MKQKFEAVEFCQQVLGGRPEGQRDATVGRAETH
jgi:hypothetical protein